MTDMKILVQKFGGTSVANLECMRQVQTKVLEGLAQGYKVIAVLSARAGDTNKLLSLAEEWSPTPDRAACDVLVSTGEQVSISLFTMLLKDAGIRARSLLGWQIPITTDNDFGRARIRSIDSKALRVQLENYDVLVVAGFQGCTEDGRITKFTEKPEKPDSNLASMGIYIFSADVLIEALEEDALDQRSSHDFGKDIIPKLLGENKRLYSYEFHGFWKDVGTIASFHETSMDLLGNNPEFDLFDKNFPIMSNITTRPPHYIGPVGRLDDCLVSNGCKIYGTARHSILSTDVIIEERAVVEDSVLLPGAHVKSGAHICRAILGENSTVEEGVKLGSVDTTKDTAVVGNDVVIGKGE